ncbi:MAG TPA: response regulator transcription factor [Vicinamibacteria bacterium]|jgi:DNA-binding NarL/FixJ family response regulator
MTRIVLADDHPIVRQGLRALLEKEPGFSVVGEASDGLKVADLVEETKADVLVLDVLMPGLGGLDVTREVARRSPKTRIVVLSMHSSEAFVLRALRNGASAYVLKDSSTTELVRAVRQVQAGGRYLSTRLSERAIESYIKLADGGAVDVYETLTTREREVLHLAAEGLTNPEIGERLHISPRTAEVHRAHIMEKLGLKTRTDLIAYALRRGLIPSEAPGAVPPAPKDEA